jgi:hypothetical protein
LGIDDGHPFVDGGGTAEGGAGDASGGRDATLGDDAGGRGEDGGSDSADGSSPGEPDAHDAGVANAMDTGTLQVSDGGCTPATAIPSGNFFVAPPTSGGIGDGDCGAMAAPCSTIVGGLRAAGGTPTGTTLYIAAGTYEETVNLVAGLNLSGGWTVSDAGTWSRSCPNDVTEIEAPPNSSSVVTAHDLNKIVLLSTLSIVNDKTPGPGQSLMGLVVTGAETEVDLSDVQIATGAAGNGAPGAMGGAGASPTDTCVAGDAAAGTQPGGKGLGADAGYFEGSVYVAAAASQGGPGANGENGAPGGDGGCDTCLTCGGLGCTGTPTGTLSCGSAGQAGCGAGGGNGGQPGTSGGSSVALLVVDGVVKLTNCVLSAGNGGAGGPGGPGGRAGVPSMGAAGAPGMMCTTMCPGAIGVVTNCPTTSGAGDGGLPGSPGGGAAAGGPGGDGAGGDSFSYVKIGNGAVIPVDGESVYRYGSPGYGPDGGNGASGTAGEEGP